MQGVPNQFEYSLDRAEFRHFEYETGLELYRAYIIQHTFEPHLHAAFGLGVIDKGIERFRYRGADNLAGPGSIILMNPDELHTGQAETTEGWAYRMAYIDAGVIERILGQKNWWFNHAVQYNSSLAQEISDLISALWRASEPLAIDSILFLLLNKFQQYACVAGIPVEKSASRFKDVIEYMRANLAGRLTLEQLANIAQLSPHHFLRSFQRQYYVTPQQMLMALRLFTAKQLLTRGEAPAQIAYTVGLADQAHLTKTFFRRYGVTPAHYQRQVFKNIILK